MTGPAGSRAHQSSLSANQVQTPDSRPPEPRGRKLSEPLVRGALLPAHEDGGGGGDGERAPGGRGTMTQGRGAAPGAPALGTALPPAVHGHPGDPRAPWAGAVQATPLRLVPRTPGGTGQGALGACTQTRGGKHFRLKACSVQSPGEPRPLHDTPGPGFCQGLCSHSALGLACSSFSQPPPCARTLRSSVLSQLQ